jgi:hypothetical protein
MKSWGTENYVHAEYQVVRRKANRLFEINLSYLERFEEENKGVLKIHSYRKLNLEAPLQTSRKRRWSTVKTLILCEGQNFKAYQSVGKNER